MLDYEKLHEELLRNIKKNLPELELLLEEITGHWNEEDLVYRYYHQSFKVYFIQSLTMKIFKTLKRLAPKKAVLNDMFLKIYKEGTGKVFSSKHNKDWEKHTRPMLEAFFHAKYFLCQAVKYGKELEKAPECLPSGWAGLLYFYNLR